MTLTDSDCHVEARPMHAGPLSWRTINRDQTLTLVRSGKHVEARGE